MMLKENVGYIVKREEDIRKLLTENRSLSKKLRDNDEFEFFVNNNTSRFRGCKFYAFVYYRKDIKFCTRESTLDDLGYEKVIYRSKKGNYYEK